MAIVLSRTQTSVVTVAGTLDNPVTITSTGLLLAGLYANSLDGAAWTVTNAGSVLGAGITLQSVGTVTNSGSVAGGGTGVDLLGGGYVGNAGGGMIAGGEGAIYPLGEPGGAGGDGVDLAAVATLSNSGTIVGGNGGLAGNSFSLLPISTGGAGGSGIDAITGGTIANSGAVSGGSGGIGGSDGPPDQSSGSGSGGMGGGGVDLAAAGGMTNTGTIWGGDGGSGGGGVYIGGGTLVNAGTIIGGAGGQTGGAVEFGSLAATLAIDPGAVFDGAVTANPNAADTMELGGAAAGSLSGIGDQFTGFTRIAVDPRGIVDSQRQPDRRWKPS